MSEENNLSVDALRALVLKKRDEGEVVWLQHDGDGFAVVSAPIEEFIQQPADGILYDLNRLEEIALTYMAPCAGEAREDRKWVNDFAVALTIRALKEERDALLGVAPVLTWYAEKAEALKRYAEANPPRTTAMTAVVTEMSLDGGAKASEALTALPAHLCPKGIYRRGGEDE